MGYVITGILCFMGGTLVGITTLAMCMISKESDIQQNEDNPCYDCFGASFGDCEHCPKKEGENSD